MIGELKYLARFSSTVNANASADSQVPEDGTGTGTQLVTASVDANSSGWAGTGTNQNENAPWLSSLAAYDDVDPNPYATVASASFSIAQYLKLSGVTEAVLSHAGPNGTCSCPSLEVPFMEEPSHVHTLPHASETTTYWSNHTYPGGEEYVPNWRLTQDPEVPRCPVSASRVLTGMMNPLMQGQLAQLTQAELVNGWFDSETAAAMTESMISQEYCMESGTTAEQGDGVCTIYIL
ncbi:hypothetical protein IAT40_002070 [Kwoniella sp. CBS 6097]